MSSSLTELDVSAESIFHEIGVKDYDRALKSTMSLCADCLVSVPAVVFERDGKVILGKRCGTHGYQEALIENDASFYYLSNKDKSGQCFAPDRVFRIPEWKKDSSCCGGGASCGPTDQEENRTCTVLYEVTDACNLSCRVCYSDSKGDRFVAYDQFVEHVQGLLKVKGSLESIQLTGGESTLHPRFWDMVDYLYQEPRIQKVYVPTNGLRFAKDEQVRKAEKYADKLMLLLQFDAFDEGANQTLRQANPANLREKIVSNLGTTGVPLQLTMTLAQDVNESEVSKVVEFGLKHNNVKVIALQPVTWSGRYSLGRDPMRRLTLSDIAKAVASTAKLKMEESDFLPIPCSHPNCGWISVFFRRFGLTRNMARYVDMEKKMDEIAYKTLLSTSELKNVVGSKGESVRSRIAGFLGKKVIRSTDMFSVAIKPFMDRYTYDQDRIDNCCHHITDTKGQLWSFCEYNALGRQKDSWASRPTKLQLRAPSAEAEKATRVGP